jgi:shikimate dehydrogenase
MRKQTSIYGLIGYPLDHSLSPWMHNAAFKELKVDATYQLFPLKEEEVKGFFASVRDEASPIFGLNVTVPYKEKVIPYLNSLSPFALKVMAVNTIVITKDRKLVGYNTDGPGFLADLAQLNVDTRDKRVAILGAGGAARAIVSVLCLVLEKPASIRIYDIDRERLHALTEDLKQRFDTSIVTPVYSIDDLNIELADILINATPVGLKKEDPCLVEKELLHPKLFVYDLIYNPARTPLLNIAQSRGAQTANGLGMLFYQGVLAFQHWAEIQLSEKIKAKMRKALEEGLKESSK